MTEPIMLGRARRMRRGASDAERKFWTLVRNRRLRGYKVKRQVWIGPFIADFVCESCKLIIEIDGGQHATQQDYDAARTQLLKVHGYQVVRFWSNDVLARPEAVMESLLGILNEL